jgi:hypothetical protein
MSKWNIFWQTDPLSEENLFILVYFQSIGITFPKIIAGVWFMIYGWLHPNIELAIPTASTKVADGDVSVPPTRVTFQLTLAAVRLAITAAYHQPVFKICTFPTFTAVSPYGVRIPAAYTMVWTRDVFTRIWGELYNKNGFEKADIS